MAKKKQKTSQSIYLKNKKAYYNYEIIDKIEVGIILTGTEIKSIRAKQVDIAQAYVKHYKNEVFIVNMRIDPYEYGSFANHEPTRMRKLLLHKKQIINCQSKIQEKGLVYVPLELYLKKHLVKIMIGLGRGKKLYDKRSVIRDRENKLDLDRMRKHTLKYK